jgi:peptide deformylase
MIRRLIVWPDRRLRFPVEKQTRSDCVPDSTKELIVDMLETMWAANGVGLSATQIGLPLRISVIDTRSFAPVRKTSGPSGGAILTMINPEILGAYCVVAEEEGCLSLPGVTITIPRPAIIRFRYLDVDGQTIERYAEGMLARAVCHEIEHLDGHTILEHLPTVKRQTLEKNIRRHRRLGKGVLKPV